MHNNNDISKMQVQINFLQYNKFRYGNIKGIGKSRKFKYLRKFNN